MERRGRPRGSTTAQDAPDPTDQLLRNYRSMCRLLNEDIHRGVLMSLTRSEEDAKKGRGIAEIVIEADLSAANARALATALLVPPNVPRLTGSRYPHLRCVKIWRSQLGPAGVAAWAEVLRLGGDELALTQLELVDAGVDEAGCFALGRSLAVAANVHLRVLRLDYNVCFGSAGMAALSRGLRTNRTLEELHTCFCSLSAEAGVFLADIVAFAQSGLRVLNVQGNRLEGTGLNDLAHGLMHNTVLKELNISDNALQSGDCDVAALRVLAQVLSPMNGESALEAVDLQHNRIGIEGGTVLMPYLTSENKRVRKFLVDFGLPAEIFAALHRNGGKGKKGKGKKKKAVKK